MSDTLSRCAAAMPPKAEDMLSLAEDSPPMFLFEFGGGMRGLCLSRSCLIWRRSARESAALCRTILLKLFCGLMWVVLCRWGSDRFGFWICGCRGRVASLQSSVEAVRMLLPL